MLEEVGISAEVVDPRTMWPLDEETLIKSVKKTSRCIVMDEGYGRYSVAAELASIVQEGAFYDLDGAGAAPLRDARADSVFAVARRRDGADEEAGRSTWRARCAIDSWIVS